MFSETTVIVHRASVIVTDLLFVYACYRFMTKAKLTSSDSRLTHSEKLKIWFFINYFSLGMFMIDNIHFQYNSMLYALMILSICFMMEVSLRPPTFLDTTNSSLFTGQIHLKRCHVCYMPQLQAHLSLLCSCFWTLLCASDAHQSSGILENNQLPHASFCYNFHLCSQFRADSCL